MDSAETAAPDDVTSELDRPPLGTLAGVLHRALTHHVAQRIEDIGGSVTRPAHLYVLRALSPDSASVTELAERCDASKQAISQVLDVLDRLNLTRRVRDPQDGRGKLVELTPEGREALAVAVRAWGDVEREWADLIGGQSEMQRVREAMLSFVERHGDYRRGDRHPRIRPIW
ncbi:MarR family transcriptional regulator [Arthrobacter sp. SLBN-100]|uniref:MarR family winged helix-turn-helix transcriptional regulator n=1 Tax=Arthrobacter sp. SLBN-100 TaxID=2768450 RepID=UPI0011522161|nr:MarR family transcriptional regulator [Arthrobacter sp. SLBN-100]TQJ62212.1 MarR family transcriptional regulator [Arthrobacter sp. SLBN-100]